MNNNLLPIALLAVLGSGCLNTGNCCNRWGRPWIGNGCRDDNWDGCFWGDGCRGGDWGGCSWGGSCWDGNWGGCGVPRQSSCYFRPHCGCWW